MLHGRGVKAVADEGALGALEDTLAPLGVRRPAAPARSKSPTCRELLRMNVHSHEKPRMWRQSGAWTAPQRAGDVSAETRA